MTLERKITWLLASNAVINWTLSAHGIVDPVGLTNWAWIPSLLCYDVALRAAMKQRGVPSSPGPRWAPA
jgi:hypothetical protein